MRKLMTTAGILCGAAAALAGVRVTDPFRAADAKWPTHEKKGCTWRSMMMHTRGSGRQCGVPLGFYIAYYLGAHTADMRPGSSNRGGNWGIAPNLAWRTILLGYYQGCNYQAFGRFPWAFVKDVEKVESVGGVEKKGKELRAEQLAKYAGVEKHSDSSVTTYHDEYAQDVRFFPPGGVRVFEIRGVACHAKTFDLAKIEDPDTPSADFPLEFRHDKVGDCDEAVAVDGNS